VLVLYGFNKNNIDNVGFLALNDRRGPMQSSYKITHDINEALKFPKENIDGNPQFGTPAQWYQFFLKEPSLKNWQFHFVKLNQKRKSRKANGEVKKPHGI